MAIAHSWVRTIGNSGWPGAICCRFGNTKPPPPTKCCCYCWQNELEMVHGNFGRITWAPTWFICSLLSLKFRLFTCLTRFRMCVGGVFSWLSTFIILRISCQFLSGCFLLLLFLLEATRIFCSAHTFSVHWYWRLEIFDVFAVASWRFSFHLRRNLFLSLPSLVFFCSFLGL